MTIQITAILTTLPSNAYPHYKKYVFFLLFFLIDTYLMINFITKIDTNRKY